MVKAYAPSKSPLLVTGKPLSGRALFFQMGQKRGQQADQRQEGADVEDVGDAGVVGEPAQQGGTDAGGSEGQPEKYPRDQPDAIGNQFLGINHNRRKGRGQHEADHDGQHRAPEKIRVR